MNRCFCVGTGHLKPVAFCILNRVQKDFDIIFFISLHLYVFIHRQYHFANFYITAVCDFFSL